MAVGHLELRSVSALANPDACMAKSVRVHIMRREVGLLTTKEHGLALIEQL